MMLGRLFEKLSREGNTFCVPEGHIVYAVGDVHGRAELLVKLCDLIRADLRKQKFKKATVVFLGDYIDRGYQSREVIEYLLNLAMPEVEIIFLAGNHEDMLMQFLVKPHEGELWLKVGGVAALASYGVFVSDSPDQVEMLKAAEELKKVIPREHLVFLKNLRDHARIGDYLFVHAGLRPGIPFEAQRRRDKLGIRGEFTEMEYDFGMRIVHGHTGVRKPVTTRNRIAIDTGAFTTGVLTAVVVRGANVRFLQT